MSGMSSNDRSPPRAPRRATRHAVVPNRITTRAEAVRDVERELERWLGRAVPDPSAPLDGEAVARLVGDCISSLGLDEAGATSFTVNTVHFYRRKEILDPPEGRTSAARYTVRHIWQAIGARLAGQLALLTLAEAREAMAGRSERVLLAFVAERVLDARARQVSRRPAPVAIAARPLAAAVSDDTPSGAAHEPNGKIPSALSAIVVPLSGDAWCVVPLGHPARRSAAAARALGQQLADAIQLGTDPTFHS
jgi:hypothetical protein